MSRAAPVTRVASAAIIRPAPLTTRVASAGAAMRAAPLAFGTIGAAPTGLVASGVVIRAAPMTTVASADAAARLAVRCFRPRRLEIVPADHTRSRCRGRWPAVAPVALISGRPMRRDGAQQRQRGGGGRRRLSLILSPLRRSSAIAKPTTTAVPRSGAIALGAVTAGLR